jgi:integrase
MNITSNHAPKGDKPFVSTPYSNLVRRASNGVFYLHAKIGGKLYRESLDTSDEKIAVEKRDERCAQLRKEHQAGIQNTQRLTFEGAVALYRKELEERLELGFHRKKNGLQPKSKIFYEGCLSKILSLAKPDQLERRIDKFSKEELQGWLRPVQLKFSATLYNGCAIVFRDIFNTALEARAILVNPATRLDHETPKKKNKVLPTLEQWNALIREIRSNKLNRRAEHSADVTEFLTYTGARITEATLLRKADVLLDRNLVHFREGTTKNGKEKFVPIIPECLPLLKKWLAQPRKVGQGLLPIKNVNKAISNACARIGLPHLSQHDFRHLFASNALRELKDAKVVSTWLGHQDGGTLLADTYAHVNAESDLLPSAQKICIGGTDYTLAQLEQIIHAQTPEAANVIRLPTRPKKSAVA